MASPIPYPTPKAASAQTTHGRAESSAWDTSGPTDWYESQQASNSATNDGAASSPSCSESPNRVRKVFDGVQPKEITVIDGVICGEGVAVGVSRVEGCIDGVLLSPAARCRVVPARPVFHPPGETVLNSLLKRIGVLGFAVSAGVLRECGHAEGIVGVRELGAGTAGDEGCGITGAVVDVQRCEI